MSRRIARSAEIPAHVGHPMDRLAVTLRVEVCGPSTGRSDGKPSREPWPDEDVVVIAPAPDDDEAWDRFNDVSDIKLPLSQLRALIGSTP